MNGSFVVVAVVLVAAAALGLFLAFQNPQFLMALIAAGTTYVVTAVLPTVIKAAAPKDFTAEQIDRIRRGEDPFRDRPREH